VGEYVARLCWNSSGWTGPTSEATRLEHGTYVAEHGVGHEDWLFDPASEIDGWRYGFLQPVSKPRERLADSLIDVRLFTIGPESRWLYVGRLPECHVLTEAQAAEAKATYRRSGRLRSMRRRVKELGANLGADLEPRDGDRDPRWLVNVRYRPESAVVYRPPIPIPANHLIRQRIRRYELVELRRDLDLVRRQWPRRGSPLAEETGIWPDELPSSMNFSEGAAKTVTVNAYERDPRARNACIAHHGRACCVCG